MKIDKDTLDSTQYVSVVDLISEGEIQGLKDGLRSIYLNNTPLQNPDGSYNFQEVTVDTRNGTQEQSYIPITTGIENEIPVGVVVEYNTPVVRTITDQSVNAVRITISVPQLQRYESDGDIRGEWFTFQVQVQYNGAGYTTVLDQEIKGRTSDLYQRDYSVGLSGAFPVDIRVVRTRVASTNPQVFNDFSWASYTEITYAKPRYPNSALVAMSFNAAQFSAIPTRSYLVRGIKVHIPNNATVDSATGRLIYNGIWNGTFGAAQWCSDPAWILWDLLTSSRYGFGDHIQESQLDRWAFYSASQYASQLVPDGFGGQEPRFSCNVNIQTAEEAYKLINDMCSVFRVMPYWSTGALTISQDKPSDYTYYFTPANVTEGGFTYQGGSRKNRPTVCVVSYLDLNTRDIAYEVVEDAAGIAKYGVVKTEISAFACTSRGQAYRIGEWLLYSERYESEVVTFTAAVEAGVLVRPGALIKIADPVRSGERRGGRIVSATTTTVTVDNATGLTSSGTLSIILPNGAAEERTVTGLTGNTFTVSTAFSVAPANNGVWLYGDNTIAATLWRVLSVQEQDDSNYAISAIAYDPSKYDYIERGTPLQERDVTNLDVIPAAPTGISFIEALQQYQNEIRSTLLVSWQSVTNAASYQVRWRKDNGNYTIATVPSAQYELVDITPGTYEFKIFSLSAALRPSSTSLDASFVALGKTAPPADVTNFMSILDSDIGVTLNWSKNTELDIQGYEIWQGNQWGTGTLIGLFSATSAKVGLLPIGTTTWWIKALDTSGVYSLNAISTSLTVGVAPAPTVQNAFKGTNIELIWTVVAGNLATQAYEIRYGSVSDTWATATVVGTTSSTVYSTRATWLGTRRWFVAAIDLNGSYGAPGQTDAQVIAPSQAIISQQVVDNNVFLQWNDTTSTLPVDLYELRKGSNWATAEVIGTKQGRFTSVFEVAPGTYTYWLAGIDSAGNYGAPSSVSVAVSQPPDYILRLNVDSTFNGTRSNVATLDTGLISPVDTTETWQSHFTTRSWSTPQDQITVGYPYYAMPSASTGYYEEVIDYGAVLAATKITATLTSQIVAGTPSLTPTISTRKLNTDPWINNVGLNSVFATDFRYIKIRYDFASTGGDDLLQISALNIRLDAKLRNDFGSGTASASDVGGTTVSFNIAFVDVEAISVTPATTNAVIAVYDFVDALNPTTFKVLLFNTAGSRVSGPFSWSARGV